MCQIVIGFNITTYCTFILVSEYLSRVLQIVQMNDINFVSKGTNAYRASFSSHVIGKIQQTSFITHEIKYISHFLLNEICIIKKNFNRVPCL